MSAKIGKLTNKRKNYTSKNNSSFGNLSSISHHQSQLDINRAVGTSRSRCRAYRRHRCRRYGVRGGLLRTPAASPWTCSCGSRCALTHGRLPNGTNSDGTPSDTIFAFLKLNTPRSAHNKIFGAKFLSFERAAIVC